MMARSTDLDAGWQNCRKLHYYNYIHSRTNNLRRDEGLDFMKFSVYIANGSFHVKSSDFWPFFHGPPPILLKFGTLVEIV